MIKAELARWLERVAVVADAEETRALIMQCMTPLVKDTEIEKLNSFVGRCRLGFTGQRGERHVAVSVRYIVDNRAAVSIAWQKALVLELRAEPCRLITLDGRVADGLKALLSDRPLLTLVAVDDDFLELQVGGFDKSMVVHSGNLMGLTQQVIEEGTSFAKLPRRQGRKRDFRGDDHEQH